MICDSRECPDNLFGECTYTNEILHLNGYVPCKYSHQALSNDIEEESLEEEGVFLTTEEYNHLLYVAGIINEDGEVIEEKELSDGEFEM